MATIEFKTKVKNGMIEVPAKFRDQLETDIRVIVMIDKEKLSQNLIDQLLENPLQVENFFPLKREEVYAKS